MKKPTIIYPVVVEGRYDKIKLSSLFEGQFICTDGFGIFKNKEKKEFFLRIAEKSPLIILTDSDDAGKIIRRFFSDLLPKDRIIALYTPQIPGKEKRKSTPSKAGFLGVEGMEKELLYALFKSFTDESAPPCSKGHLTRIDLYTKGYDGRNDSKKKRQELCKKLGLPLNLSISSLLDALNLLYTDEELSQIL